MGRSGDEVVADQSDRSPVHLYLANLDSVLSVGSCAVINSFRDPGTGDVASDEPSRKNLRVLEGTCMVGLCRERTLVCFTIKVYTSPQ